MCVGFYTAPGSVFPCLMYSDTQPTLRCVFQFFAGVSTGVKRACCDFLNSQLDPSNCLGIRDFAETHNCLDLMQAAELFSQKHFAEVVQQEEFMLLSQGEVEKLIKCDEIQVRSPERIS